MICPDGNMCLACTKLRSKCNRLPFSTYPKAKNKLDKNTDDQMVVCKAFIHTKEIQI